MTEQIVRLHRAAPAKPNWGEPCNGCGVCCAAEPCPMGRVLTGRQQGACELLQWNDVEQHYRCGAINAPRDALPRGLRWLSPLLAPLLRRLARRWIAAGKGCDSDAEPVN